MRRLLPWLGLALGCGAVGLHSAGLWPWMLDDAFITFRYAEHFADGHGLVYNTGERVEGYTTFLWALVLGIGHALGAHTPTLARVLGATAAAATLAVLAWLPRLDAETPQAAGPAAAVCLGTCGVFSVWALGGMEVPLIALWTTLSVAVAAGAAPDARRRWALAGVVGALALLTRPDAVVLLAVLSGLAGLRAFQGRTATPLLLPGIAAGLYAPYFAWRYLTYGWLLPNTFYAKVGSTEAQVARGVDYTADFAVACAALLVLATVGAGLALHRRWALGGVAAVVAGAHAAYVVAVGGDVMPAFRFFAAILPLVAVLAGTAITAVPQPIVALALLAATAGHNQWAMDHQRPLAPRIHNNTVAETGLEVGAWLRAHAPPDTLLATNTAGSVAWASGLPVVDMLGLNDAHIAHRAMPNMGATRAGHEKADGAYVLSREPDLVHFGSSRGSARPVFRSDRELFRLKGFKDRYQLQSYRMPSGTVLKLFVRDDLLARGFPDVRPPPEPTPPAPVVHTGPAGNLLVILADDVGTDKIALYEEPVPAPPTPTFDRLAAEGVLFWNAWATPVCSPTRAGLLTGRHSRQHGVTWALDPEDPGLPSEEETLPELLDRGTGGRYEHAWIGKWHLAGATDPDPWTSPQHHGFRHFQGMLGNFYRKFAKDGQPMTYTDWEEVGPEGVRRRSTYVTTAQADAAIEHIQRLPEPWLVVLALSCCHDPIRPPPAGLATATPAGGGKRLRAFHQMVEAMDREVGRVVDAMGPDVRGRTTVLYLSDNGTPSSVPGGLKARRLKDSVFEGGIRVPLVVAGPDVARPGSRSEALVQVHDVFATVAELAGIERTDEERAHTDSVSLVPYLRDPDAPSQRTVATVEVRKGGDGRWLRAVRGPRYKLIDIEGRPARLYDLQQEPREGVDLLQGTPTAEALSAAARLREAAGWTDGSAGDGAG